MTDSELVHRVDADGVATVTLDSPGNRNALSARLRDELRGHLRDTAADDAVRVVLLDHTSPSFCSGMDLKESREQGPGVHELPELLELIWTHPKPVIAKVAGSARAGGVGIIAACDIAVANHSATFAFSEVRIGVVPAVISVTVLPRLAPRAAQELFLTGEVFTAERAAQIGLLTASVAGEDLHNAAQHYMTALSKGAPAALTRTKQLLTERATAGMEERFQAMLELSAEFFASEQAQEGMRAFADKRAPDWVP